MTPTRARLAPVPDGRSTGVAARRRAATTAGPGAASRLLALQRTIGNRALGRVLREGTPAAPRDRPRSLPSALRAQMAAALGGDFTAVRVYEGAQAPAIGARAYTDGRAVHVASGLYEPGTRRGQELLGHELAHVVQQAQGRVAARTHRNGVALNGDRALEAEASAWGARAAAGARGAAPAGGRAPTGPTGGVIQCAGFTLEKLVDTQAGTKFSRDIGDIVRGLERGYVDALTAHRQLDALIDRFTADWKNGQLTEEQVDQFVKASSAVAKAIPQDPESDPARVRIARAALAAEQVGPNRASAIAVPLTSSDADVVRWYDKRETKEFGGKATSAAELSVRSGRIRAAVSGPGAGAALGTLAETYPFTGAHVDALGDASAPIVPVAPIPFAKEVEASARTVLPSGGVGPANRFVQALTDAEFPVGPIRTAIEDLFERSKLLLGGGAGARLRSTIIKVVVEGARAGLDVANPAVRNFLYGIAQGQASEEGSDSGSRSNTQTVYRGEVDFDQHQVPERRRN